MPIVKHASPSQPVSDERRRLRDFAGLLAELEDANPVARRWAARDLAQYPEAAEALAIRLTQEENPTVREAIFTSLTMLGGKAAVDCLVRCLRSEDAALRNEAVEAMKALPDAAASIMDGLLADSSPDVRIFAVNILESLCHDKVEAWLMAVAEKDPHINVCAAALDLLAEVGTESAVGTLQRVQRRFPEEPYIQFAADVALRRIGGS